MGKNLKMLIILEYICVTSKTRNAHATGVYQTNFAFFQHPGALMCDYDLTNIQLPAVLILLNCTIHVAKTKVLISFAVTLRSYEAELRLCFRIGNNPIFSRSGPFFI